MFSTEIDPEKVTLCNCLESQKLIGCAYRLSVPAPITSFKLLTGKPEAYSKAAESGAIWLCSFCPDCGAPIYSCAVYQPPIYWPFDELPRRAIRLTSQESNQASLAMSLADGSKRCAAPESGRASLGVGCR
jgi:hypothetical protein